MILYLKHVDIEGPETLGDFFEAHGFKSSTLSLQEGDIFPDSLHGIEAVIGLGGPMNVDEEEQYSWLKVENKFIQNVVAAEIPYLGLCLGSQLLAKACGAKVLKSPAEEIGFSNISLTSEGLSDPLFKELDSYLNVFQWHGDMFMIPENGRLLASSVDCPHQAFRIGRCAYGLQFHVEITPSSIEQWANRYIEDIHECASRKTQMLNDYHQSRIDFEREAQLIYKNFLQVIQSNRTVKDKV